MVKKILLMMLVAFAALATSSCSKDDPSAVETYTIATDIDFKNFSAEDQPLINEIKAMIPAPKTVDNTLNYMKSKADEIVANFANSMNKIAPELTGNQTVTMTVEIFKGSTTSGSPVYNKKVIATKNSVEIK